MFQLTNEQRRCFALAPIQKHWECIEAKPSPYDNYKTFLFFDNDTIVKCIQFAESRYCEYELSEKVSLDRKYLLPKTAKGKPVLLSSSTIQKRRGIGMRLNFVDGTIFLYNENTECDYYSNRYLKDSLCNIADFSQWVENWCAETTNLDIEDVVLFSRQERRHVRFQEGDVFRFKIDRRLYGYGRILLDYEKMRKKKIPFWDILMCKPLICSVYHVVTSRSDLSVEELKPLLSLPSTIMTDNSLYYGEYEIIGNLPVTDQEDYPIMYGDSLRVHETAVCYQCGKVYRRIENETELYREHRNNGVSFYLNFTLDLLLECIKKQSNAPYWKYHSEHSSHKDLRDPKFAQRLRQIHKQFGL